MRFERKLGARSYRACRIWCSFGFYSKCHSKQKVVSREVTQSRYLLKGLLTGRWRKGCIYSKLHQSGSSREKRNCSIVISGAGNFKSNKFQKEDWGDVDQTLFQIPLAGTHRKGTCFCAIWRCCHRPPPCTRCATSTKVGTARVRNHPTSTSNMEMASNCCTIESRSKSYFPPPAFLLPAQASHWQKEPGGLSAGPLHDGVQNGTCRSEA